MRSYRVYLASHIHRLKEWSPRRIARCVDAHRNVLQPCLSSKRGRKGGCCRNTQTHKHKHKHAHIHIERREKEHLWAHVPCSKFVLSGTTPHLFDKVLRDQLAPNAYPQEPRLGNRSRVRLSTSTPNGLRQRSGGWSRGEAQNLFI